MLALMNGHCQTLANLKPITAQQTYREMFQQGIYQTLKRGLRGLCTLIKIFLLKMRRREKSWIVTDKTEKNETENRRAKKGKRNIQGKHLTRKL